MNNKKAILSTVSFILINILPGCATQGGISPTAPDLMKEQPIIREVGISEPKLKIRIKNTQIDISETDLTNQISSAISSSENNKITDIKLNIEANDIIKIDGSLLQKIPLKTFPLRIPLNLEGNLKLKPQSIIELEINKVKFANIPVKSLMDFSGTTLEKITHFKDSQDRVQLKENNFIFYINKFTNGLLPGQITSVTTSDKTLTINF